MRASIESFIMEITTSAPLIRKTARALRLVTFYHSFNIAQKSFKDSNCYFGVVKKRFFCDLLAREGPCSLVAALQNNSFDQQIRLHSLSDHSLYRLESEIDFWRDGSSSKQQSRHIRTSIVERLYSETAKAD